MPTTIGLWLVCTGGLLIIGGTALAIEIMERGPYPRFWQYGAALLTGSAIVGWLSHRDRVRKAYRPTR